MLQEILEQMLKEKTYSEEDLNQLQKSSHKQNQK